VTIFTPLPLSNYYHDKISDENDEAKGVEIVEMKVKRNKFKLLELRDMS